MFAPLAPPEAKPAESLKLATVSGLRTGNEFLVEGLISFEAHVLGFTLKIRWHPLRLSAKHAVSAFVFCHPFGALYIIKYVTWGFTPGCLLSPLRGWGPSGAIAQW
jgi:hypothetical protein